MDAQSRSLGVGAAFEAFPLRSGLATSFWPGLPFGPAVGASEAASLASAGIGFVVPWCDKMYSMAWVLSSHAPLLQVVDSCPMGAGVMAAQQPQSVAESFTLAQHRNRQARCAEGNFPTLCDAGDTGDYLRRSALVQAHHRLHAHGMIRDCTLSRRRSKNPAFKTRGFMPKR
jgi:hypothetical protein